MPLPSPTGSIPHAPMPMEGTLMSKNASLLTLDRLRLAVSRVENAKKRSLTLDDQDVATVDNVFQATIRRDVMGLR